MIVGLLTSIHFITFSFQNHFISYNFISFFKIHQNQPISFAFISLLIIIIIHIYQFLSSTFISIMSSSQQVELSEKKEWKRKEPSPSPLPPIPDKKILKIQASKDTFDARVPSSQSRNSNGSGRSNVQAFG